MFHTKIHLKFEALQKINRSHYTFLKHLRTYQKSTLAKVTLLGRRVLLRVPDIPGSPLENMMANDQIKLSIAKWRILIPTGGFQHGV